MNKPVLLKLLFLAALAIPGLASAGPGSYLCRNDDPGNCQEFKPSTPTASRQSSSSNWTRWSKDTWQRNIAFCKGPDKPPQTTDGVPCSTVFNIANSCENHASGKAPVGERFAAYCEAYGLGADNEEWRDPNRSCTTKDYEDRVAKATNNAGSLSRYLPIGDAAYRKQTAFARFMQRSMQADAKMFSPDEYPDTFAMIYTDFVKNGPMRCIEEVSRADHAMALLNAELEGKGKLLDVAKFIAEIYADDIMLGHVKGVFKHMDDFVIQQLKTASRSTRQSLLLSEYKSTPADYLFDAVPSLKPCMDGKLGSAAECLENLRTYAENGKKYSDYVNSSGSNTYEILDRFPPWLDPKTMLRNEVVRVIRLCNPSVGYLADKLQDIRTQCRF